MTISRQIRRGKAVTRVLTRSVLGVWDEASRGMDKHVKSPSLISRQWPWRKTVRFVQRIHSRPSKPSTRLKLTLTKAHNECRHTAEPFMVVVKPTRKTTPGQLSFCEAAAAKLCCNS